MFLIGLILLDEPAHDGSCNCGIAAGGCFSKIKDQGFNLHKLIQCFIELLDKISICQ